MESQHCLYGMSSEDAATALIALRNNSISNNSYPSLVPNGNGPSSVPNNTAGKNSNLYSESNFWIGATNSKEWWIFEAARLGLATEVQYWLRQQADPRNAFLGALVRSRETKNQDVDYSYITTSANASLLNFLSNLDPNTTAFWYYIGRANLWPIVNYWGPGQRDRSKDLVLSKTNNLNSTNNPNPTNSSLLDYNSSATSSCTTSKPLIAQPPAALLGALEGKHHGLVRLLTSPPIWARLPFVWARDIVLANDDPTILDFVASLYNADIGDTLVLAAKMQARRTIKYMLERMLEIQSPFLRQAAELVQYWDTELAHRLYFREREMIAILTLEEIMPIISTEELMSLLIEQRQLYNWYFLALTLQLAAEDNNWPVVQLLVEKMAVRDSTVLQRSLPSEKGLINVLIYYQLQGLIDDSFVLYYLQEAARRRNNSMIKILLRVVDINPKDLLAITHGSNPDFHVQL